MFFSIIFLVIFYPIAYKWKIGLLVMENNFKEDLGEQIISKLKVLEMIIMTKFKRIEDEQKLQDTPLVRIRA